MIVQDSHYLVHNWIIHPYVKQQLWTAENSAFAWTQSQLLCHIFSEAEAEAEVESQRPNKPAKPITPSSLNSLPRTSS